MSKKLRNQRSSNISKSLVIIGIVSATLALFQFWPFTLIFLLVGAIATGVISGIVGHPVSFSLILLTEYLLMLMIIFLVIYITSKE